MKQFTVCAGLFVVCACTTTSMIRPADNLKEGEYELSGGASASTATVVPVAKATVGLTDSVEAGLHFETFSVLGDVRLGLMSSEIDGVAVAAGLTAGVTREFEEGARWYDLTHNLAVCAGPTLTIGRRFGRWEIYAGGKFLTSVDPGTARNILAGRLGGRVQLTPNLLIGLEGGGSRHSSGGWWSTSGYGLPEGSAYLGVKL